MVRRRITGVTLLALVAAFGGCQSAGGARVAAARAGGRELRKCTILIPVDRCERSDSSPDWLAIITDRLYSRFGGFTVAGPVHGAYRLADGSRADDWSVEIWVAVDGDRLDELRHEVAALAGVLRQERVYFEVSGATVEFVEPRR